MNGVAVDRAQVHMRIYAQDSWRVHGILSTQRLICRLLLASVRVAIEIDLQFKFETAEKIKKND